MKISRRLQLLQSRHLINGEIEAAVMDIADYLAQRYAVDIDTPQVEILLVHIANALGRVSRRGCAQPLNQQMYAEIQTSLIFPKILHVHEQLLAKMPYFIPYGEQTHMIANLYSLALAQPKLLTATDMRSG